MGALYTEGMAVLGDDEALSTARIPVDLYQEDGIQPGQAALPLLAVRGKTVALTDASSIATNLALGNVFTVTLGGNRTLANPTNPTDGAWYTWRVTQDGTGNRTLAYGSKFLFPGGAPTASTAAGAIDVINARYMADTDKYYGAMTKAYAA